MSREAEIASTDRPPARDDRRHSALDHGEEEIHQRGRHACTAARKADAADDERRAADGFGQRLADTDHTGAHQLLLEGLDRVAIDTKREIGSEAGVQPVDRLVTERMALDDGMCLDEGVASGLGQGKRRGRPGQGIDVLDREGRLGQSRPEGGHPRLSRARRQAALRSS